MNTAFHVLEDDLTLLSTRLTRLEKKFDNLTSTLVPASLPVDKMQLASYERSSVALRLEDEEEEEEEVSNQPNVNRSELVELVSAIRDYLEWSQPHSHLSAHGSEMVAQSAQERLERALRPVESELKRANYA